MTKTYSQLQQQIARLQQEAEAVRAKEVAGVVARIQEAIRHYGLTPDDLFAAPAVRKPRAAKAAPKAGAKPAKKAPAPPKYTDGAGRTWSGHGKRPGWYLAALASGKKPQDLEITASNG